MCYNLPVPPGSVPSVPSGLGPCWSQCESTQQTALESWLRARPALDRGGTSVRQAGSSEQTDWGKAQPLQRERGVPLPEVGSGRSGGGSGQLLSASASSVPSTLALHSTGFLQPALPQVSRHWAFSTEGPAGLGGRGSPASGLGLQCVCEDIRGAQNMVLLDLAVFTWH